MGIFNSLFGLPFLDVFKQFFPAFDLKIIKILGKEKFSNLGLENVVVLDSLLCCASMSMKKRPSGFEHWLCVGKAPQEIGVLVGSATAVWFGTDLS